MVGTLKDWWENFLTSAQREEILNVVKQKYNEIGAVI